MWEPYHFFHSQPIQVWDSVTLQSGTTCLIILGCWTSAAGSIETRILGVERCKAQDGKTTADKVDAVVRRVLGTLRLQPAQMRAHPGQGLAWKRSAAAAAATRTEMLTCVPLDRAYCGRTGNKADKLLLGFFDSPPLTESK
jgi:hypothetical protein